jgi:predicted AAA+ superfamily ATPase
MFAKLRRSIVDGLAPITVLRGPRQVGKSTLQDQLIESLLLEGISPRRILKVQFEDLHGLRELRTPILTIVHWFESRVLQSTLNDADRRGETAFLFFDEVQNLEDWAPELKLLVDTRRVRVMVTGSSALRIEAGRDSLAGRIETVEIGPLMLREVAHLGLGQQVPGLHEENGLDALTRIDTWRELVEHGHRFRAVRNQAFARWSSRGGYPRAQERFDRPWPEVADNLKETVVDRAIQHDLRVGSRGRKRDEALLREMFRIACRHTGTALSHAAILDDIRSTLNANIGLSRSREYLKFLESSLLIKLVPPLELRLKRKRGAPKLCVCDHGLRAAWLQETVPLVPEDLARVPHLADVAGHIVEGAVGQFLTTIPHLDVAHLPERAKQREVDFVLTVGTRRVPIEVKYRRTISADDLRGLRQFVDAPVHGASFGVVVTQTEVSLDDDRIVAIPLSSLLLLR